MYVRALSWRDMQATPPAMRVCMMHTVTALLVAVYACSHAVPARSAPSGASSEPKNVLYIVVDDLRPDLEPYGEGMVHTPNLQALAERSLIFDRAYCQFSFCAPSRQSFMTGRRPDTTQCWNFLDDFRETVGQNWTSFPQYFKKHGYFTSGVGKLYHPLLPPNGDPPSWSDNVEFPYFNPPYLDCPNSDSWCSLDPRQHNFSDELTLTEAVRRLRFSAQNHSAQPFFLGVGFKKPHLPFRAPLGFIDLYPPAENITLAKHKTWPKDSPTIAWHGCLSGPGRYKDVTQKRDYVTVMEDAEAQRVRRGYYAAVSFTDSLVGRLLAELKSLGLEENTIVSFHSDHGWQLGEHNMWCKMSNFELGVRVPWMVHVPGVERCSGQHTSALAELVDVYPTLAELAGLPAPPSLDGRSQAPVFFSKNVTVKTAAVSQFPKCGSNLTRMGDCERTPRDQINYMGYSIRTDLYRYTEWMRWNGSSLRANTSDVIAVELYDHHGDAESDFDAYENENVVAQLPTVAAELSKQLRTFIHSQFSEPAS